MLGWIGATLLAICALPQTILCIRQGHARGISHMFLLTWYIGELCMLFYLVQLGLYGPLFWNYVANAVMLTIITKYKYWERRG